MSKMKKPIKAIIYVRKNINPENIDGNAIANQFQEIIEYAFKNNIKIIRCYCDIGQPRSEMSPDLEKMLSDINTDRVKPEAVICTDFNKFGRSFGVYHKVKEALDMKNIQMVAVNRTDRKHFELMNSMHKHS